MLRTVVVSTIILVIVSIINSVKYNRNLEFLVEIKLMEEAFF